MIMKYKSCFDSLRGSLVEPNTSETYMLDLVPDLISALALNKSDWAEIWRLICHGDSWAALNDHESS